MTTDTRNIKQKKEENAADFKASPPHPAMRNSSKNAKAMGLKALKYMIIGVIVVIFGISAFLWYVFYGPKWGTMYYGVCKVFAERMVDFPSTMKVREVQYYRLTARVYISHIDASGQFNYNVIECEYGKGSYEITRVRVDRKILSDTDKELPVNPDILNNFNKGLNAILINPPDLLLPRSTQGAPLVDLWRGEG